MTIKSFTVQGQVEATNIIDGKLTASAGTDAMIEVGALAPNWWSMYGDLDFNITEEFGAGSVYDAEGNLYVVGTHQVPGLNDHLLLLKYDANGTLLWSKSYTHDHGQINGESIIYDTTSGHLYVLTTQETSWFGVIELTTDGDIVRKVHGDIDYEMTAWDLTIDPSGNIYIIGDQGVTNINTGTSQVVFKIDSVALNFVWGKEFTLGHWVDEKYQGKGFGAVEYSNGYVYVTGGVNDGTISSVPSDPPLTQNYSYVAKLDATTGDQVWLQDTAGGVGMGLCLDDADNVYTTYTNNTEYGMSVIAKFDSSGVFQWARSLMFYQGGGDTDINYDNGYVYATGVVYNNQSEGPTYNGSPGWLHWAKVDATTGDVVYQQIFGHATNLPLTDIWRFRGHDLGSIHNGKLSIAAYAYESTATSPVPANMITLQLPLTPVTTGTYGQYSIEDFAGNTGTFTTIFVPANSGLAASFFNPLSTVITNVTTSTAVVDNTLTNYTQLIGYSGTSGVNTWTFGNDAKLTLPAGGDIVDSTGATVLGNVTVEERYYDYNQNSLYGTSGLDAVTAIGDDDEEYEISLPFTVTFLGTQYNSVWLSSNSYISFLSVAANSPPGYPIYWPMGPALLNVPTILVGAADRNITNYYYGSTGDGRFVIRYEGVSTNSSGDTTQTQSRIWEVWFYEADPGKITIVVTDNLPPGGVWGLHDGIKWIDVYEELPRPNQNTDGDIFNSIDIYTKTPVTVNQLKFVGAGVETYTTGSTAFVEINPLQGILNLNLNELDTVITSAGGGLTLRSNHFDDINIESNSDVNISAFTPTSDYPGQGKNVYINAGNGGGNVNFPNQSGGHVYISSGLGAGTSSNGNVTVTTHDFNWVFSNTGTLVIPGDITNTTSPIDIIGAQYARLKGAGINGFSVTTSFWTGTANWVTSGTNGYIEFNTPIDPLPRILNYINEVINAGETATITIDDGGQPIPIISVTGNSVTTLPPPPADPTPITIGVNFQYTYVNSLAIGNGSANFTLDGLQGNFSVLCHNVEIESTNFIDLSGSTVSIGANEGGNININAGNSITSNGGDVSISAGTGAMINGNIHLYTNGIVNHWTFGGDGSLTLPNGAKLNNGTNYQFATDNSVTQSVDLRDSSGRGFYTGEDGYTLRSNGTYNWIFGGDGNLTLPTGGMILNQTAGYASPTSTTRSAGTKIVLFPQVGTNNDIDYALGIAASTMWFSVPTNSSYFKFYNGVDNNTVTIDGTGKISANSVDVTSLNVGGSTTFMGPVTFSGTATYVLSTNTVYTDNIIELHTHPGGVGTTWASDDGKDIGFRFHHYANSTDTNAALVLANDTKYLEWYGSGAESTSSGVIANGTYGTFKTGSIQLTENLTVTGTISVSGGGRINPRVVSTTTAATLSWSSNNSDQQNITALGTALTISADSGTPVAGQKMMFYITDNGNNQLLTWTTGANGFKGIGVSLPGSTVAGKITYVGCVYNAINARWDVIAVAQEA